MYGYAGKILRVDLSEGRSWTEVLDEATAKKWVGGSGLGTKYLVEEIPPKTPWSDPENRLIIASGPLGGSGAIGGGSINITGMGPMTGMAAISQANGFMGAYMKFSGFDGIVLQGASPKLVYIVMKNGRAEIKDAGHLAGKMIEETEDIIRKELGVKEKDVSVYGIGPAGENLVHFAAILGDRGHAAGHNGLGAIMGSKKVKAIVAFNGPRNFELHDPEAFKKINNQMFQDAKGFVDGRIFNHGTGGGFEAIYKIGQLPIKNYTETTYDNPENLSGQRMREIYEIKSKPCYKCAIRHVKTVTVTEGPYKGLTGEEPEYEQLAAWGPQIGNNELGAVVMLVKEVDGLGLECNEAAWVVGWAMECFEKGVFTLEDTDGIDLSWGNVEGTRVLLNNIARREGKFGNLLADGVRVAAKKTGGEAADWAVYTEKGATPRGHDHRGRWSELFDTCVTNTGSLEATWGGVNPEQVDWEPIKDLFSHEEVSTGNARFSGFRQFEDCLGYCKFCSPYPKTTLSAVNAITGWNWTLDDVHRAGRRINQALRVFSYRQGLDITTERPSKRYGSVPEGGFAKGKDIMARWDFMLENYYTHMGWDPKTGRPLDETLKELDLAGLIGTF
jgi:aldehyde:ferredoxin oxidoreductase